MVNSIEACFATFFLKLGSNGFGMFSWISKYRGKCQVTLWGFQILNHLASLGFSCDCDKHSPRTGTSLNGAVVCNVQDRWILGPPIFVWQNLQALIFPLPNTCWTCLVSGEPKGLWTVSTNFWSKPRHFDVARLSWSTRQTPWPHPGCWLLLKKRYEESVEAPFPKLLRLKIEPQSFKVLERLQIWEDHSYLH